MEKVVDMSKEKAIEYIDGTGFVHYRYGVWNRYKVVSELYATEQIKASPYGADVYTDNVNTYVSCPANADMW